MSSIQQLGPKGRVLNRGRSLANCRTSGIWAVMQIKCSAARDGTAMQSALCTDAPINKGGWGRLRRLITGVLECDLKAI